MRVDCFTFRYISEIKKMAFKELLFSLIVAAVLQCIVAQPRPPALTSAVSNMLNQPRVPSLQQQNMMKLVSLLGNTMTHL